MGVCIALLKRPVLAAHPHNRELASEDFDGILLVVLGLCKRIALHVGEVEGSFCFVEFRCGKKAFASVMPHEGPIAICRHEEMSRSIQPISD